MSNREPAAPGVVLHHRIERTSLLRSLHGPTWWAARGIAIAIALAVVVAGNATASSAGSFLAGVHSVSKVASTVPASAPRSGIRTRTAPRWSPAPSGLWCGATCS